MENVGMVLYIVWYLIFFVQIFFSYGTAYRLTKKGGDNGVALFGWFLLLEIASIIPGLAIYFWIKTKNNNKEKKQN